MTKFTNEQDYQIKMLKNEVEKLNTLYKLCISFLVLCSAVISIYSILSKQPEPKDSEITPSAVETSYPRKVVSTDKKELECLTEALWFEARGESTLGIKAVANVIKNRRETEGFPETFCKVIEQPLQFSYRNHLNPGERATISFKDKNTPTYGKVSTITLEVLQGSFNPVLEDSALYFTSTSIKPPVWTKNLVKEVTIDKHVFYKEN